MEFEGVLEQAKVKVVAIRQSNSRVYRQASKDREVREVANLRAGGAERMFAKGRSSFGTPGHYASASESSRGSKLHLPSGTGVVVKGTACRE